MDRKGIESAPATPALNGPGANWNSFSILGSLREHLKPIAFGLATLAAAAAVVAPKARGAGESGIGAGAGAAIENIAAAPTYEAPAQLSPSGTQSRETGNFVQLVVASCKDKSSGNYLPTPPGIIQTITSTVNAYEQFVHRETGKRLRFGTTDGKKLNIIDWKIPESVVWTKNGQSYPNTCDQLPVYTSSYKGNALDVNINFNAIVNGEYSPRATFGQKSGEISQIWFENRASDYKFSGFTFFSPPEFAGTTSTLVNMSMEPNSDLRVSQSLMNLLRTRGYVPFCAPHSTKTGSKPAAKMATDNPNDLFGIKDGFWQGFANISLNSMNMDSAHDDYNGAKIPGCLDVQTDPLFETPPSPPPPPPPPPPPKPKKYTVKTASTGPGSFKVGHKQNNKWVWSKPQKRAVYSTTKKNEQVVIVSVPNKPLTTGKPFLKEAKNCENAEYKQEHATTLGRCLIKMNETNEQPVTFTYAIQKPTTK